MLQMNKNTYIYKKENMNLQTMTDFAKLWGSKLISGDIICLDGDLGAGKTTMTQSIAEGMGILEYVTSPSYTIICEYSGQIPLYHMDVYRLGDEDELFELGFDEYIYGDGVCVIEWASKIENSIPKDAIRVHISVMDGGKSRLLLICLSDDLKDRWGDLFESFGFRY